MHKMDQSGFAFPGADVSAARSNLWLPSASLSSCIRAVVARDTRCTILDEPRRYNHFAATPLCTVTWYFSGSGELLAPGSPANAASPRTSFAPLTFCGPLSRPLIVWNPGPIHAMMLMLHPDALAVLTGIDPGSYLDRIVPAATVLDESWLHMCREVAEAPEDDARVRLISSFLEPRWRRERPGAATPVRLYSDWSQSLVLRAATSSWGRSLRQIERRIKRWTGQPLRELRGLSRAEQAFFDSVVSEKSGSETNWSKVASNVGYADQSHLCRQTRRITGFPPEELRRRVFGDETFWIYRLWGFSDGQPPE